jgi:hypothetical protein
MNGQTQNGGIDLTTADGVTELETLVQCRLNGELQEFRLVVRDKGLVLRGRARTYYAKHRAEIVVGEITQLPILANEIEVS